ncbi:MAG: hypothetical protein DRR04_12985 [Gammaproteobacteria bacterium]|nr:MAG: hypothetical protein DRR04_12985 [Gammaproteobacteria bacterium]
MGGEAVQLKLRKKRVRLAKNLHVEFSAGDDNRLCAGWDPGVPATPSRQIWKRYKLARDIYLQEMAVDQGISMVLVDCEGLRAFKPTGASQTTGWNEL